jgi:parvulin-like peptidyl-prolyl isomerase
VVARIGERSLEFAEFESFVAARAGAEWSVLEEQVLAALFESFVDEAVLMRLAEERGVVPGGATPEEAASRLRDTLAVAEPTPEQVRRLLEERVDLRRRSERLTLGQILVQEREPAERLLASIRASGDFEAEGRRAAGGDGVVFSGYLADVVASDLPAAFRDVVFALEDGAVSDVIEADYGYHLFHVRERRPPETVAVDELMPEALEALRAEASEAALRDMISAARESYGTEVLARNLPFFLGVEEDLNEASR